MTNEEAFENNIAHREASHIKTSDDYFNARPQIDSNDRRKVFEAGHERGWQAAIAYMQEQGKSAEQSEPVMAIRLAINEILESGEKLPPNTRELVYFIKNVSGEILFQDPIAQVTKHGIFGIDRSTVFEVGTKLYTTPQRQQPLKRLSDEFKDNLYEKYWIKESLPFDELIEVVMDAMQEINK